MKLEFEWDEEKERINISKHVFTVVYTVRTTTLRIISARIATKKEKDTYYGN